jgi:hypothetical protein
MEKAICVPQPLASTHSSDSQDGGERSADDAVILHGVLEGRAPFLQKPFKPDPLAWKLPEVLDRES